MSVKNSVNSSKEYRAIFSLASILSFRMLGLFMIFPVFAVYAPQFKYATPALIGIALGCYGLTQALLQLPLSMLSDHIGRKPVIIIGLLLFSLGSIIAAMSHSVYILIIGRTLQGAGAIGSTIMAYAADVTRLENRTKAMALLGVTIGLSFAIAMILGPFINNWLHLSGIFWITALLALSGIGILHFGVPAPLKLVSHHAQESFSVNLKKLLRQSDLFKLNLSILLLHAILTGSFVAIPLLFNHLGFTSQDQWKIYLPLLLGAFIIVIPIMIFAERRHLLKPVVIFGILVICIAQFILYYYPTSQISIMIAFFIFFVGFTLLEAILPSLTSRIAPSIHKGSAMGIYSSCQFLGIFLGGSVAGLIHSHFGYHQVFLFCAIVALFWLGFIFTMKPPLQLKTKAINIHTIIDKSKAYFLCTQLHKIPGIVEANISIDDSIAYLKVDNKIFDQQALEKATDLLLQS